MPDITAAENAFLLSAALIGMLCWLLAGLLLVGRLVERITDRIWPAPIEAEGSPSPDLCEYRVSCLSCGASDFRQAVRWPGDTRPVMDQDVHCLGTCAEGLGHGR